MNERRVDPFTGRGVIIAPGRRGLGATRPAGLPSPEGRCPFCPGHEADAEPTLAQWPAEGPWRVRVMANKYPVAGPWSATTGVTPASGRHEVGVDTAVHDADLADLDREHASAMLRLYRDRVRTMEADVAVAAAILFRNRGRRAGSSQPHPHTQIAALSWIPAEVALRWRVAGEHLEAHGESVHDRVLRMELEDGRRVLGEDDHAVLLCPYAPSRPLEMRIVPRHARAGLGEASDEEISSLAAHLVDASRRLARLGITDHNLVLRQPPARARGPGAGWHLDILPRTGGDAGFELATGEMIVVVAPEEAAAALRSAR